MRLLNTVIYTDKLGEVRSFYEKNFRLPLTNDTAEGFGIQWFGEAMASYLDAAAAGLPASVGVVLQIGMPFAVLERGRLITLGVECSEIMVKPWGPFFGKNVQYFSFNDPSGALIQLFEDHFGEEKQLMTTGDGTETRKVSH
jgi:hypothetical protein